MDKVRIGIIGVGGMGTFHSRYLLAGEMKDAELTAVCDIDEKKLEAEAFANLKKFKNSGDLIRSGEVDAVIIATPHYDHTTIGIDAFENNLHVLVEKPISVHKADCERLIAAAKKTDKVFQAMFQLRTDNTYKKLKALIDSGELGKIVRINWIVTNWFRTEAYYASGGWRATWSGEGGGVLMNQCPHNLDLFQWFFGLPSKVTAFLGFGKRHDIEVEDEVTAYFEYADGCNAVFITSTCESPGTNRMEITAERGRVIMENNKITFTRNEMEMTEFSRTTKSGFSAPQVWNCEIPVNAKNGSHKEITQNFINAILNGEEQIAPAVEGIKSVELANAMIFSGWTGKTVDVPLDAAAYEVALKEKIATSRYQKKEVVERDEDMNGSFK